MNEIIDVEYTEVTKLEDKSTEELTEEVNSLYAQIETIGAMGCVMMAQAGKRLSILKEKVGHGKWLDWMKENLDFSKSKAEYMMKYAEKSALPDSVFSNSQSIGNIGTARLFALLDAPEEVAKEVVQTTNLEDITVKELKETIKSLKEENEVLKPYRETVASLREENGILQAKLNEAEESAGNEEEVEKLRARIMDNEAEMLHQKTEMRQLQKDLTEERNQAKAKMDAVKKKLQEESAQEIERTLEKEREDLKKQAEKDQQALKDEVNKAKDTIADLERKLKTNSQTDIAVFKVKSNSLQQDFNSCMDSIDKMANEDPEQAEKMKNALRVVMNQLIQRI